MANTNEIIEEISKEVEKLAKATISKYAETAKQDVAAFLESSKQSITLWTTQLTNQEISIAEFEYLVGGLRDIAELKILKHAGLAQQRVGQFIGSVLNIVINVILKQVIGD